MVGFAPLAHRPPLSTRFWLYCTAAYIMPVVAQVVLPDDPAATNYDELVWLITLAPAFLLSLHYGLKGAVAGLLMGTSLFITVQLVVALNYTADDSRVTVPIYIAYGTLAIAVGWLSEQLHDYYQAALKGARLAAIGEFAVTIRHEVNNALTAIVAESQLLSETEANLSSEGKAAASNPPAPTLATSPSTRPARASTAPCRSTIRNTLARLAPIASRMPISLVLRLAE